MTPHLEIAAGSPTAGQGRVLALKTSAVKAHSWTWQELLPVAAGLLAGAAFEPVNLFPLAFVALVPLLMYLDGPVSATRIIRGTVLFSLSCYGFVLNWFPGMVGFSWLAVPGYLGILFIYTIGFFTFTIPVVLLRDYLKLPFLVTAPVAWVTCERLRGYGDLAFPWCTFGYSLGSVPFLVQFAEIVGVFGVSFWLVGINVIVYEIVRAKRNRKPLRKYAIALVAIVGLVIAYDAYRWFGNAFDVVGTKRVAVIQPNVPQRIKWDERYSLQVLDHVFAMNRNASGRGADLVVWPETAIPYYVDEQKPFHLTEMGKLPSPYVPVLSGLLTSSRDKDGETHYYNAAGLFDAEGNIQGLYKKIYLVPGSEQYPFRTVLGFTRAFFSVQDTIYGALDPGTKRPTFVIPGAKFSVMICYESVYPQLARDYRRVGANFLVNITNDAWFGHSFAPYQHATFLVFRAIENRMAIVRAGNTGISGFVDPRGRWLQKTPIFTEQIISQTIPLTSGLTFYSRFGDVIVDLSYAAMAVFLVMALKKKLSESRKRGPQ